MPSINNQNWRELKDIWLQKNSRAIQLFVFFFIIFLGFIFLIYPQFKKIKETGTLHVQETKNQLEERNDYLSKLKAMEENFGAINLSALSKLQSLTYKEEEVPYLYAEIEKLFTSRGLNIQTINTAQDNKEGIGEITVNLTISGEMNYENLKVFLGDIENNSRILSLESLSYAPNKASTSLTFKSYYLANEGE